MRASRETALRAEVGATRQSGTQPAASSGLLSSRTRSVSRRPMVVCPVIVATSRSTATTEIWLKHYLRCVGRENTRVFPTRTRTGGRAYRAAFSDTSLYDWLFARGIRPAKSLTLGAVEVPPVLLPHFLRGLIDGDGTIYVLRHRPTPKRYPDYWYVRLWTYFTSASRSHIEWLREELLTSYGLHGYVERQVRKGRHDFYRLKFGKSDSLVLLT